MASNPARQKRTAESHARYADPSSKKPRFDYRNPSTLAPDAPDDDPILDLDEVGRSGLHTKRNAVNLDGFDSDSSTENFEARAAGRTKAAKKKAPTDADTDMFGDDADEDEDDAPPPSAGKKAAKEVRFLEVEQFEGQVYDSRASEHYSAELLRGKGKAAAAAADDDDLASDSGSDGERAALDPEVEDADELGAGAKRRHAPRLDAFNMREEGEDGKFDESGNYVRKATDPDAVHDNWLDGVNKRDMRRAREAQDRRDEERRVKERADDAVLTSQLLSALIARLEPGETAVEALQRLGGGRKNAPKWKQKKQQQRRRRRADGMDVDEEPAAADDDDDDDDAEKRRLEAVDAISGAADQLFSRDQPDVYDQERELLMRQYKRETGEDWAAGNGRAAARDGEPRWEYRWADARDGGEAHGPYDGPTVRAWIAAGYFGEGVEYRRVGTEAWSPSADTVG